METRLEDLLDGPIPEVAERDERGINYLSTRVVAELQQMLDVVARSDDRRESGELSAPVSPTGGHTGEDDAPAAPIAR